MGQKYWFFLMLKCRIPTCAAHQAVSPLYQARSQRLLVARHCLQSRVHTS